jgi:hypothetical protein
MATISSKPLFFITNFLKKIKGGDETGLLGEISFLSPK